MRFGRRRRIAKICSKKEDWAGGAQLGWLLEEEEEEGEADVEEEGAAKIF